MICLWEFRAVISENQVPWIGNEWWVQSFSGCGDHWQHCSSSIWGQHGKLQYLCGKEWDGFISQARLFSLCQWVNRGRMVLCKYPGSTWDGNELFFTNHSGMMCRFRKDLGTGFPGPEGQCHAQQSWGGVSWVVLQRSVSIRLGRAAKSPGVLRTLVIHPLYIRPAVPLTHIYGVPVCFVSSAYRWGDQERVWMEGEPRTELCRELRLRGLWELKYSCFQNEWAITSVPTAEMSSTRCLESTYWEWHRRLGHRHQGCLVEGVYMHCEWVEWWVEDGEMRILQDFLTVNSGREMGAAARRWLRLEKESSFRYLMTSAESDSLHTQKKRKPSSLTLMENST